MLAATMQEPDHKRQKKETDDSELREAISKLEEGIKKRLEERESNSSTTPMEREAWGMDYLDEEEGNEEMEDYDDHLYDPAWYQAFLYEEEGSLSESSPTTATTTAPDPNQHTEAENHAQVPAEKSSATAAVTASQPSTRAATQDCEAKRQRTQ